MSMLWFPIVTLTMFSCLLLMRKAQQFKKDGHINDDHIQLVYFVQEYYSFSEWFLVYTILMISIINKLSVIESTKRKYKNNINFPRAGKTTQII